MAAYIDLNPVRAGLVADPKDYRWCGYAEAVAGRPLARNNIRLIMNGLRNKKWDGVLKGCRVWMFGIADEMRGRGGIPPERVDEVIRAKGELPLTENLRCRVRYFVDGAAIGSKAFVEDVERRRALAKQEGGAGGGGVGADASIGAKPGGRRRQRRGPAALLFQGLDGTQIGAIQPASLAQAAHCGNAASPRLS